MNQNWSIHACIGVFALTFAGGFALIMNQRKDEPKVAAPAPPKPDPEPEKKPPEKKDRVARDRDGAPKEKDGVGKDKALPVPSRPILIKQWQGTQPPKPKGENSPNYQDFFYRELAFDQSGTRLIGRTSREAVCWDAIGGTRLNTFPAATRTTPRKPPNPPDFHIDQEIRISPQGRTVALIDRNGKTVTLYEAGSGEKVGTYTVPRGKEHWIDHNAPEFTFEGDYLLFAMNGTAINSEVVCALNAASATGRLVDMKRKEGDFNWIVLAALPRESTFVRQIQGDRVVALDLRTGAERPLKSITVKPFSLFENRGIKFSPNRRYLSARTIKSIEIVDWKEDKRLMQTSAETIHNEWWTPDGKRFVMLKSTDWIQYVNNQRTTPIGGWLELWDAEKGVKISTFAQDKVGLKNSISALAFSADGKRFAIGDLAANLAVLDFETAFQVAPLPPVPPAEEREYLPTR